MEESLANQEQSESRFKKSWLTVVKWVRKIASKPWVRKLNIFKWKKPNENLEWWFDQFWGKFIVPLLIVIGTLTIQGELKSPPAIRQKVTVGFADFSLSTKGKMEEYFRNTIIEKANGALGDELREKYEYDLQMVGGGYEEVLQALRLGRIDIGFVPPFTYVLNGAKPPKGFREVGFKYPSSGLRYYSGLLVEKALLPDSCQTFPNIKCLIDWINDPSQSVHLILNSEEKSTSTRAIPSLFLLKEKMLGRLEEENRIHYIPRSKMIQILLTNCRTCGSDTSQKPPPQKYIGFLALDDWMYAQEMEILDPTKFEFVRIPIPIPYDAVLIYKKKWNERYRTKKHREDLIAGLRYWIYKKENTLFRKESWRKYNQDFINLVSSGVVEQTCQNGSIMIRFLSASISQNFLEDFYQITRLSLPKDSLSLNPVPDLSSDDSILKYPNHKQNISKLDTFMIEFDEEVPTNKNQLLMRFSNPDPPDLKEGEIIHFVKICKCPILHLCFDPDV